MLGKLQKMLDATLGKIEHLPLNLPYYYKSLLFKLTGTYSTTSHFVNVSSW